VVYVDHDPVAVTHLVEVCRPAAQWHKADPRIRLLVSARGGITQSIHDVVHPWVHACAVLASAEQGWEVLAGFIADGLDRGERVILVGLTDRQTAELTRRLREDGVDPEPAARRGDLVMISDVVSRESFQLPTQDLTGQLVERIDHAVRAGYRGLRLSGLFPGVGIAPHEATLDRLVRDHRLTVFCPYPRSGLTVGEVERVRALHDVEVTDPALYDDGMLRITRPRPGWLRLAGRMNATNHTAALPVLTAAARAGDRDIDLTSLRDIDTAAAHA
jgi:hypothetical protein